MLTEKQKWLISLYSGLLFLVVASPLVYLITGGLTRFLGMDTSTKGCPNWKGLALHAIVFAILVRVMMMIPAVSEKWAPPIGDLMYLGLSNPAAMLRANAAQLAAENNGCSACADTAKTCMRDPRTEGCTKAQANCNSQTCNNPSVVQRVHTASQIGQTPQYFAPGTPPAQCGKVF